TGGLPRVGVRLALTAALTEAGSAALDGGERLGPRQRAALEHLVDGAQPAAVVVRAADCDHSTLRALQGRGLIELERVEQRRRPAARFEERFGDTVAILHSRLGQGERHDEWLRLRRGEARVCVGPRSAVFAPLTDLGLIVIDEEHDSSYKQEGDPRYDARRVPERRGGQSGAVPVAGSAPPRP